MTATYEPSKIDLIYLCKYIVTQHTVYEIIGWELYCIYKKLAPSTACESLLTVLKMNLTKRTEEFKGTLLQLKKKNLKCR